MKKLLKYPDTMAIQQETLLDYSYYQNCQTHWCRFIKTNTTIPQQNNFIEKLEENSARMIFTTEKQQKTILNFSLDLWNWTE